MTNLDLRSVNEQACSLLHTAACDYAAARCCLLNGLLSGFQLASQAVEKLIKASILFHEPTVNIRTEYGHDLPSLLKGLETVLNHSIDPKHHQTVDKLLLHYKSRYPDNPDRAMSASSDELDGIDELCFFLTSQLFVPSELKYRVGILARVCRDEPYPPDHYWITQDNNFFKKIPKKTSP
ncbi:MAG: hypothetical protein IBX55_02030 [Methyloprofundus sp.]|nr:hypothetical protein [Methyloprofundus sp.]